MIIKQKIAVVLIFSLTLSCDLTRKKGDDTLREQFGLNYNAVRKSLSIPPIENDWMAKREDSVSIGWIRKESHGGFLVYRDNIDGLLGRCAFLGCSVLFADTFFL